MRVNAKRSPVEGDRFLELIRGKIHIRELRERHVVVGMRRDPGAQRLKLGDDGSGRAALDSVL